MGRNSSVGFGEVVPNETKPSIYISGITVIGQGANIPDGASIGKNCFVGKMKGFGIFKGCCGYIILGPIGWLCGLCGMGEGHTSRKAFWICDRCGRKFKV
jgi:hypothetical protein